ncbi:MAG: hypothetical protein ACE5OQ_01650 [Woeseia sp.]
MGNRDYSIIARILQAICCAGLFGFGVAPVGAAEDLPYQVVDNIALYIGLMPAAIIAGHPSGHLETTMHGGALRGKHRSHLVLAAFDESTGERITQATVFATVMALGGVTRRTQLMPMTIADVVTFGNYVYLPNEGLYRIKIELTLLDSARKVEAIFQHVHAMDQG